MTAVHTGGPGGQVTLPPTSDQREAAAGDRRDAIDEHPQPRPDAYDPAALDAYYNLLKNERRRRVVRYLDEVSATTTLSDLAEHIAAIENDKPERALNAQERKRVYIQLYQYHLPAMDKVGVIEFEGDRGTVERTPEADHLTELLAEAGGATSSPEPDGEEIAGRVDRSAGAREPLAYGGRPTGIPTMDTWATYYLGLGLVGAGLFVLQRVAPVAALVDGAVVGVLLMAAVTCALVRAAPRDVAGSDPVAETAASASAATGTAVDARTTRRRAGDRTARGPSGPWSRSRVRRSLVEQPSANGTVGRSAD